MTAILQAYRDQLGTFRKVGVPLASFLTPCCSEAMHSPMPPTAIQIPGIELPLVRDCVQECPFCGEHFRKVVHADGRVDADIGNAYGIHQLTVTP